MTPLLSALCFAQLAGRSWSDIAIATIVLAGIFAIVVVVLRQLNIPIPPVVVALFWIIVGSATYARANSCSEDFAERSVPMWKWLQIQKVLHERAAVEKRVK
jgi:hypothetical protein